MKMYRFYITLDGYGDDVDDALIQAFETLGIKNKAMIGEIDYEEIQIEQKKIASHMIINNTIEEVQDMSEVKIKKIEKRLISLEKQVEEIQKILDKTYGNSLSLANKNKENK